jgi:hypothetical protein
MITPLLLSSVDGEQPGTIVFVQTFRPAVAIWTRIICSFRRGSLPFQGMRRWPVSSLSLCVEFGGVVKFP